MGKYGQFTRYQRFSNESSGRYGHPSLEFVLQRGEISLRRGRGTSHGGKVFNANLYEATAVFHAALSIRQAEEKSFFYLTAKPQ